MGDSLYSKTETGVNQNFKKHFDILVVMLICCELYLPSVKVFQPDQRVLVNQHPSENNQSTV